MGGFHIDAVDLFHQPHRILVDPRLGFPTDFAPIIVITQMSFLIKTGVLSALLIGIRKLWEWLRCK